jgi:hypothetical protein
MLNVISVSHTHDMARPFDDVSCLLYSLKSCLQCIISDIKI